MDPSRKTCNQSRPAGHGEERDYQSRQDAAVNAHEHGQFRMPVEIPGTDKVIVQIDALPPGQHLVGQHALSRWLSADVCWPGSDLLDGGGIDFGLSPLGWRLQALCLATSMVGGFAGHGGRNLPLDRTAKRWTASPAGWREGM